MSKKAKLVIGIDKLILAVTMLVVGILFCFSLAAKTVDLIIGIVLIISGLMNLVSLILARKSLLGSNSVMMCLFIAIGIIFITDGIIDMIIGFIPIILMVAGTIIILDSILGKCHRKNMKTSYFVIELIVGIAVLIFGICLKFVDGFAVSTNIVFGILLIIYGIYMLTQILFLSKKHE